MKTFIHHFIVGTLLVGTLFTASVYAESSESTSQAAELEKGQVAQVLAPIALYPDSLLTHVLIASTYPIEVIEAHRWAEKNPEIKGNDIAEAVEAFDWDPSIIALISFPTVLEKMSTELSWTQQLGDAFLQDEEQVLATIQELRSKAEEAGNLDKMENVKVVKEQKTIIIEPAEKEVIYVPYYDTRVVYGGWHWAHYPPVYWHYPHYGHRVVVHSNPFYWHTGVHIGFNFFFSSFHWHNHHIVVSHHHKHHRPPHHGHRKHVSHGGYSNGKRWHHNPSHRRGVAYHNAKVSTKYKSHRPSKHYTKTQRMHEKQKVTHHKSTKVTTTRHQKLQGKVAKTHRVTTTKTTTHRKSKNQIKTNKNRYSDHKNKQQRATKHVTQEKQTRYAKEQSDKSLNRTYKQEKYASKPKASKAPRSTAKPSSYKTAKTRHKPSRNVNKSAQGRGGRHHH